MEWLGLFNGVVQSHSQTHICHKHSFGSWIIFGFWSIGWLLLYTITYYILWVFYFSSIFSHLKWKYFEIVDIKEFCDKINKYKWFNFIRDLFSMWDSPSSWLDYPSSFILIFSSFTIISDFINNNPSGGASHNANSTLLLIKYKDDKK